MNMAFKRLAVFHVGDIVISLLALRLLKGILQADRPAHLKALLTLLDSEPLTVALQRVPAIKDELAAQLLVAVQRMASTAPADSEAATPEDPSRLLQAALALAPPSMLHVAHHLSAWLAQRDGHIALALQSADKALLSIREQSASQTPGEADAALPPSGESTKQALQSPKAACMMLRATLLIQVRGSDNIKVIAT